MELFRKGVIAIYNTIDYHQYKRAISLCNQLLASYRDNTLILSLKALSLYYDGQKSEGVLLCKRVQSLKPTDFGTLRALAEILRAEKMFDELKSLYQKAWELNSKDEELGNQYFMMLVGQKDFANMQKISIELNKKFPKRSYQFWSVISILLRAQFTDQKQASILYYPLAERMLTKLIYENGDDNSKEMVENFEEFYLYYRVLKEQSKLDKIEELLNSALAKNSNIEPHILSLKLDTLLELGHWDKIYQIGKDILPKDRDSWNIYLPFIQAAISLAKDGAKDSNGDLITIPNTLEFFQNLESSKSEEGPAKLKRGPYLAQLELASKADLPELVDTIEKYFKVFSSKPSCYDDLVPYLSNLAVNSKLEWIKEWIKNTVEPVNSQLSKDDISNAEKVKLTQTLVTIRKIQRSADVFNLTKVNEKDWEGIIKSLIKEYQSVLPLGEKLLSTDKQFGDDLLLLAVHYGLDIYHSNYSKPQNASNSPLLITLIYFLEFGISKSPSNYHFKFLLTRLYQLVGSFNSYGPLLKSLDIKQIQLDTLSHTWIHHTNFLGHWKSIEKEDSQCNYIYRSNDKETIDMIRLCFKNGTYSKIPEFLKFYTRLDGSLQSRLNFIELVRGTWFNSISSKWSKSSNEFFLNLSDWLEETDLTKLDNLSDNRDFCIFPNFKFTNGNEEGSKWNVESNSSVFPIRDNEWLQLQSKLIIILNNFYLEYTENNSNGIKFSDVTLKEIENVKDLVNSLKSTNFVTSDLLLASLIITLPEYTKQGANLQELNDKLKALFQGQFDHLNKLNLWEVGRKLYTIYNILEAIGATLTFIHFSQPSQITKSGKGSSSAKSGPKPTTPTWIPSLKRLIETWSQKTNEYLNQMKFAPLTEDFVEGEAENYGLAINKKLINQLSLDLNQNWKSTLKAYQVKVKNFI